MEGRREGRGGWREGVKDWEDGGKDGGKEGRTGRMEGRAAGTHHRIRQLWGRVRKDSHSWRRCPTPRSPWRCRTPPAPRNARPKTCLKAPIIAARTSQQPIRNAQTAGCCGYDFAPPTPTPLPPPHTQTPSTHMRETGQYSVSMFHQCNIQF